MIPDEPLIRLLERGFVLVHRYLSIPKWSILIFSTAIYLGLELGRPFSKDAFHRLDQYMALTGLALLLVVYSLVSRQRQRIADQRQQIYLSMERYLGTYFVLRACFWGNLGVNLFIYCALPGREQSYFIMQVICDVCILFVVTGYVTHTYPRPEGRARLFWKPAPNPV